MHVLYNISDLIEQVKQSPVKFIVVTGGVCSSIGKGILVASLGVLLKNAQYSASVIKWDPYFNVDPGTMSPLVHGEVFVTADGAETDLDLGHYERLIGLTLGKDSSVSSGQIYQEILEAEREGLFLGKCIQLVPHVVSVVKKRLLEFALKHSVDFVLVEIGGTVGDIEGEVFLEAIRQLKMELRAKQIMHAHLSLVPFLSWANEVKTKPTQHSVMALKRTGLTPDCLFLRVEQAIDVQSIEKLSIMCEVKSDYIFQVLTVEPIYKIFFDFKAQGVTEKIQEYFSAPVIQSTNLSVWHTFVNNIMNSKEEIRVGLVAKYVGSNDPYISVVEAIKSAAYFLNRRITLVTIEAEMLSMQATDQKNSNEWEMLRSVDGIVVPGGFGPRGIEGKILAAQFARENKLPYLGLCLGMQTMIIEVARSLLHLKDAHSTEFAPITESPVICMLEEQQDITRKGATMRLGSYRCALVEGTKAYNMYEKNDVIERHRHRYEVNNKFKHALEGVGVVFSGICKEMSLVEIAEIKDHPFMIGVQFHPEFQSTPIKVHPIFKGFIEAIIKK